jgi:hypothetical protein
VSHSVGAVVVWGWVKVIAMLVKWCNIALGCAGAVVGIEKCIFGGVRMI